MKILIVDDNDQMRHLLSITFLQSPEHSLLQAKNGAEALALVREFKPDIAFLDIMMPGDFDGIEVCRFIKQSDEKNCFIVLLSAKSQQSDIERGLAAGANMYLTKPFSPFHLINIVEDLKNTQDNALNFSIPQHDVEVSNCYKNIDGFDAERLQVLETMLGSQARVFQTIQKMTSDFSNFCSELKVLLDNSNFEQACTKLHTLKGSASNIGAKILANIAADIENSLKNNENITKKLPDFYNEFEKVTQTAKNLGLNSLKILDHNAFERSLIELEDCIKHDKFISKWLLQTLETNVAEEHRNEITLLMKQVKNYDYDNAALSINRLRNLLN